MHPAPRLKWIQVRRRLWSEVNTRAYTNGGFNAVVYDPAGDVSAITADFVGQLPNLLGLRLAGDVGDDAAVFQLPGLHELTLENRGRNLLELGTLAGSLTSLTTSWRKGIESIADVVLLEMLTIDGYGAPDLKLVSELARLKFLRLDLKRGRMLSLIGVADCAELDTMWLEGGTLGPSRAELPGSVTELVFNGVRGLNLDLLGVLPNVRHLRIENCGSIPSLGMLARHPTLETMTLWNTDVVDGDIWPLVSPPNLATLGLDRKPNFTHRRDDVSRERRVRGLPPLSPS